MLFFFSSSDVSTLRYQKSPSVPLLLRRCTCAQRGHETVVGGEESGPGMEFCSNRLLESFMAVSDLEPETASHFPPTSWLTFTSSPSVKPSAEGPCSVNLPSDGGQIVGCSISVLFMHILQIDLGFKRRKRDSELSYWAAMPDAVFLLSYPLLAAQNDCFWSGVKAITLTGPRKSPGKRGRCARGRGWWEPSGSGASSA